MPPTSEPELRLKEYKRRRKADELWWEVQRIKFKQNLGEALTEAEATTLRGASET